jgi:hypothetical protein
MPAKIAIIQVSYAVVLPLFLTLCDPFGLRFFVKPSSNGATVLLLLLRFILDFDWLQQQRKWFAAAYTMLSIAYLSCTSTLLTLLGFASSLVLSVRPYHQTFRSYQEGHR